MASSDEQDRIAPGAFDRAMAQPATHQLEHFGRKLRGSFVPGFAHTSEHQPPLSDHVSHETPDQPIREITRADLMSVSLLPGGQVGIAYMVREEREQPQPQQDRPTPPRQTPTRPQDDQRRTHRPTQPRQGEQERPAPNRQVRPK